MTIGKYTKTKPIELSHGVYKFVDLISDYMLTSLEKRRVEYSLETIQTTHQTACFMKHISKTLSISQEEKTLIIWLKRKKTQIGF